MPRLCNPRFPRDTETGRMLGREEMGTFEKEEIYSPFQTGDYHSTEEINAEYARRQDLRRKNGTAWS